MTARLENAIKLLTPAELQRLEELAEEMAKRHAPEPPKYLSLSWAGKVKSDDASGLDAQKRANEEWQKSIEQNLSS